MSLHLVPLGEPRKLFKSDVWAQDIGVCITETEDDIHATVYGESPNHVRQRALNFVKLLTAGKVIKDAEEYEMDCDSDFGA